jgi:uncharacterized damage-inducible protein DinB
MNLKEYKQNYLPIFRLLKKLTPAQINYKPDKNSWSIHEIITHLADTEVQSHVRFRTILANKDTKMIYFDQMDWSILLEYTKVDFKESLQVIDLMRKVNFNLLSRLRPEQFNKKGIHSVRGELSLEELINFYVQHVNKHAGQISRNLSLLQKG